jgi:hypothetical protein
MDAGPDGGGTDTPTQPIENWASAKAAEIIDREGQALVLSARGMGGNATDADRNLLAAAITAALLEAFVMGERAEKDRWLE